MAGGLRYLWLATLCRRHDNGFSQAHSGMAGSQPEHNVDRLEHSLGDRAGGPVLAKNRRITDRHQQIERVLLMMLADKRQMEQTLKLTIRQTVQSPANFQCR